MPAEGRKYILKVFSGPHTGAEVLLGDGNYTIGSDDDCDIIFCDQAVAAKHLNLTVANGHIQVAAMQDSVFIDGEAAGDGEHALNTYQIVTLGTTHFGLGPVEGKWPLPVLPQLPVERALKPAADEATDLAADTALDVKPVVSARPQSLQGRSTNLLIVAGCVAVLLLIGAVLFFLTGNPSKTPVQKADREDVQRILKEQKLSGLRVETLPQGSLIVRGYLERQSELQKLYKALSALQPPVAIQVWAMDQQVAAGRDILNELGVDLQIKSDTPGIISLRGIAGDKKRYEAALNLIRQDVPGITRIDQRVVTADRLMPALADILKRNDLENKVTFKAFATCVVTGGRLFETETQKWTSAKNRIAERFGNTFDLHDKVSFTAEPPRKAIQKQPPKKKAQRSKRIDLPITGISVGAVRYVTLKGGEKYFEGGKLKSGHVIKSIQRNRIVLTKNGREYIYLTGGD